MLQLMFWGPTIEVAIMWMTESLIWTRKWTYLSLDIAMVQMVPGYASMDRSRD